MYKVGICGNYGEGVKDYNGQTVKTRTITTELANFLGFDQIKTVDTNNWKKNNIKVLFECFDLAKKCENIVILPAQNGIKVISPLFLVLNRVFHRRIHYIVIGGWLPAALASNMKLKNRVIQFDGVYVETYSMLKSLENMGLKRVRYLPNFKRLDIIKETELVYPTAEPYKLCTFSRVMKEKGIENAIEVVEEINETFGREVFTLDIYGQVDENYKKKFEEMKKEFPEFIAYKGIIDSNDSVKTLKNYCALLFPTYYDGEGFAGTILDAYASGIPVIATNWKYNEEIINNGSDGFIYDYENINELKTVLEDIQKEIDIVSSMKKNCLNRAEQYLPEKVIGDFIKYLR